MISNYFFDHQIETYLRQFVAIFYGLQVKTGIGDCGETEMITVPIVIGDKDRVVAAIQSGNTQNRMFSIPAMSVYLSGLVRADDRRRTPGLLDQRVTLRAGGIFPDDLTVVKRAMPIPYDATIELSIYASNNNQMHQILEQILVMFDPDIQIQKSDAEFDWTRLTRVELVDIGNESNYPSGTDRRIIVWNITFKVPIYLSVPMGIKDDLVRKVVIQISALSTMQSTMPINEVDENGNLTPFGDPIGRVEVTHREPEGPDQEKVEPPLVIKPQY